MTALFVDGVIIVGYFLAIVVIGMRLGRRDASLHEFALGGRRVPWWAVMASKKSKCWTDDGTPARAGG